MEEFPISLTSYLFRARYVIPGNTPPIEDGAVLVRGGRIAEVGPYRLLKKNFSGKTVDLSDLILMPVLVNLHIHLELSVLRFRLTPSGSFIAWVKALIRKRADFSLEETRKAAREALKELWQEGIGLVADTGNTGLTLPLLRASPFTGIYFREIIDFQGQTELKNFLKGSPSNGGFLHSLSPHSPYSVSPLLIQALKSWTRRAGLPLSIHVAESPEETLFLKDGSGPIRFLLEERGQWSAGFRAPGLSPVAYLERLGVLDEKTICVHVVQINDRDIEILARHRVRPCLCPRSNIFLGVGLPPLPKLLKAGLKPGLGTDSLASNDRLSIFAEMEALYHAYPEVSPENFFLMATLWGAEALGRTDLGGLFPGARAEMLALSSAAGGKDLFRGLLENPKKIEVRLYVEL